MELTDWISILALAVAVISGFTSLLAKREASQLPDRSNKIQERLADIEEERRIEEKQAKFTCSLVEDELSGGKSFLTFKNIGKSPARNIAIRLDGEPAQEHDLYKVHLVEMFKSIDRGKIPYQTTASPGEDVKMPIANGCIPVKAD